MGYRAQNRFRREFVSFIRTDLSRLKVDLAGSEQTN